MHLSMGFTKAAWCLLEFTGLQDCAALVSTELLLVLTKLLSPCGVCR